MNTDAGQSAQDLRAYLAVLRRQGGWVVLVTLLCTAAALGYSLSQHKKYTATAQLLVQPVNGPVSLSTTQQTISPAQIQTEVQLVTSAPVEAAAQHQLGALETVGASEVGQSNLIAINSTNARPARAATIANAYAKAMVDYESSLALQSLTAAETQLQTQITNLEQEAGAAVLPAQATALQNQIALLKADLAQLEVSSATTNGGVQLVSPAVTPTSPSSPKPVKDGLLGALAGLVLGLGLAFLLDYFDDSVRSRDDIERAVPDVPVVGLLPLIGTRKDPDATVLISAERPQSTEAEAFRSLRTSIHFMHQGTGSRVITVTSASRSAGKSTVSSNLGVVFAQAGKRTVLVSADLRKPRLGRFFGMDESIGLTSVLIGDLSLSEALVAAPAPNLTVLPAGPVPPYPAELLQSQEMADVIEGLKRSFDVVIIDTPPLLPITDAAILAPLADLTLLVVVARPSLVRRGDANGSSRGDGTCSRCHHNPGWSHTRGGDRRAVGTTARPG